MDPSRTLKQKRGSWAEQSAASYLERLGLRIVAQNFRCKLGEIDIIAVDGNQLVFTEVRYRTPSQFGIAAETVTYRKQQRTIKAALRYLQQNPHWQTTCRFDVVAMDGINSINWIKDAYRP